jgi:hypothetical protein
MSVRPESYTIVLIIFYCCRKNIGVDKISRDQILPTFIKSVENKVAHDQIGGNLGGA